jgi:hypothetical protein
LRVLAKNPLIFLTEGNSEVEPKDDIPKPLSKGRFRNPTPLSKKMFKPYNQTNDSSEDYSQGLKEDIAEVHEALALNDKLPKDKREDNGPMVRLREEYPEYFEEYEEGANLKNPLRNLLYDLTSPVKKKYVSIEKAKESNEISDSLGDTSLHREESVKPESSTSDPVSEVGAKKVTMSDTSDIESTDMPDLHDWD